MKKFILLIELSCLFSSTGGNAEKCGLIQAGDKFVRINGTHVATASREEVIAALKSAASASTTVKLVLRRSAPKSAPAETLALAKNVLDAIAFGNLSTLQTRSAKRSPRPLVEGDDIYGGAEC